LRVLGVRWCAAARLAFDEVTPLDEARVLDLFYAP
jgi:hypothetical protein